MKKVSFFKFMPITLRMRLMLLVLLAVLPAFGMIFYNAKSHSEMANEQIQSDIRQLVHIGIEKYSRLMSDTQQMLQTLNHLPEVSKEQRAACHRLVASLKSGYGYYANIGANAENGELFCSAVPLKHQFNAATHSWFKKALQSGGFVISDFHMGRITGIPVIITAVGSKETHKVAFASIDLESLNRWVGRQHLQKATIVMLLDANGTILTRYPEHKTWVGRSEADSALGRAIMTASGEGGFEGLGSDGVTRVYDFAPLTTKLGHRIYIVAGVQSSAIHHQIESIRNRTLVGFGLVAIFVMLIAWYGSDAILLHRLQAVIGAARQLAAGNLEARTGLKHHDSDIGNLAQAFDDMATVLQSQNQERTQLTNNLLASEATLRILVGELQKTREEERKHIAQDIHDEVGGMLAALKMDINLLSRKLTGKDGHTEEMLNKISGHVDMLIQFVRRIITNLRPSVLDNLGLVEAIEWQLEEFKSRYTIEVSINKHLPEGKIVFEDEGYSSSLFRIFQEIITNIAKHANATMVNVLMAIVDDKFVLSVSDNGCGLDEDSRNKTGALGLISIEERVHAMDGECVFHSKKNSGTTLTIRIPYTSHENGEST